MTDIVERLRIFVPHCEDPNDYLEDELLFLKAADEIERLRAALQQCVHVLHGEIEGCKDDISAWHRLCLATLDKARTALGEKE